MNAIDWNTFLLLPPVTFIIIFAASWALSLLYSRISFRSKQNPEGKMKAYACGEDVPFHKVRPDYSQFFQFAFFFTIMHVVALMVTTIPPEAINPAGTMGLYLLAAVCGLLILFRK